jgi:hypothetical protein
MATARIDSASGPRELDRAATGAGAPLFNQLVAEFLASVGTGRWGTWPRAGR